MIILLDYIILYTEKIKIKNIAGFEVFMYFVLQVSLSFLFESHVFKVCLKYTTNTKSGISHII